MKLNETNNKLEYGNKPNTVLYSLVCYLSKIFLKLKYNIKIQNCNISGIKPPFIALGNHATKLDPFIMAVALYPHRINFLGTNYYFRNPILRPLFKAAGVIPKIQFYNDLRAVRRMNSVISRGGSLGIFPEGRRSIDGAPSEISIAIAKLIKLYKVPVVGVVASGAYLSLPRWSSFSRKGTIEVNMKPLLTAEEINRLTLEEIKDKVCTSLYFNDYEWNKVNRVSFKHEKIAENLHYILHECPSCGNEKSMMSKDNRLYCRVCGNAALMNEYGLLYPQNDNCVIFEDSVKWFEWQKNRTRKRLMEDNFSISSKVKELWIAKGLTGSYHRIGMGEIVLTSVGLTFKGIVNNEPREMFFSIQVLSSVVSELGVNFEITDGKNTYRFDLEDGQDAVRYELAIAELNS
jgi:ribosomal protein S27AE